MMDQVPKPAIRPGHRSPGQAPKWERCISLQGGAVADFAREHFGEPDRRVLLIAGGGFDPRAVLVGEILSKVLSERLEAIFLREQRPNPDERLLETAEGQIETLGELVPQSEVVELAVFEADGAVALGRHAVQALANRDLSQYSDVVVDLSALSIGCSFPVVRLLLDRLEADPDPARRPNLHAMVTSSPGTDNRIVAQPSDKVGPVHGFQGRLGLDETSSAARLWIPQLRFHRRGALERLHQYVRPDDVVPVLPFPAEDPRLGDRLIQHYEREFDSWSVDGRSIVYAHERSPLDFYRTVL